MEQSLLQLLGGSPQDVVVMRDVTGAPRLVTGQPIDETFALALEQAAKQSAATVVEQKNVTAQDVIVKELFGVQNIASASDDAALIQGIMPLQQPPILHAPSQESFVGVVAFTPDVAERLEELTVQNITESADVKPAIIIGEDVVYAASTKDAGQATLQEDELQPLSQENAQQYATLQTVQQQITDDQLEMMLATQAQQEEELIVAAVIDAPILIQQTAPQLVGFAAPASSSATIAVRDVTNKSSTQEVSKPPYRTITHNTFTVIENVSASSRVIAPQDATIQHDVFAAQHYASSESDAGVQIDMVLQPLQEASSFTGQEGAAKSGYNQPVRYVVPTVEMMFMPPQQQVAIHMGQALADGQRHINIRLHPEELGRVDIRMDISKDQVVLHITTETLDAYDIFKSSKAELARLLQESGFDAQTHHFEFSHQQQERQQSEGQGAVKETNASQAEIIKENNQELLVDAQSGIVLATQGLNIKV
jgi:flagellar hook-length control protein FliK